MLLMFVLQMAAHQQDADHLGAHSDFLVSFEGISKVSETPSEPRDAQPVYQFQLTCQYLQKEAGSTKKVKGK